jgi:hypothetical protein
MHIIIAMISAVAALLFALNRLQDSGFDLNSLNPFYWARRRAWEKQQVNPLYAVQAPRELGALLMLAVLQRGGALTSDEKQRLLGLWEDELHFSTAAARDMYGVASHLLDTDPNHGERIEDIVRPAREAMSEAQRRSIIDLVGRVADFDPAGREPRVGLAREVQRVLEKFAPH